MAWRHERNPLADEDRDDVDVELIDLAGVEERGDQPAAAHHPDLFARRRDVDDDLSCWVHDPVIGQGGSAPNERATGHRREGRPAGCAGWPRHRWGSCGGVARHANSRAKRGAAEGWSGIYSYCASASS